MSALPQQTGIANTTPKVPFQGPFRTDQGTQPSFLDRKRYVQYDSAFSGNSTLVLSSASRVGGTIANAVYRLPKPIIAYAASLKSLTLPVSWGNVLQPIHFDVVYSPGAQPYPGDFTLGEGNYTYNLYQGQVTYAQVNAQPIHVNQDDLVWYILRWFSGGVDSITINPITGAWTWVWNNSITTVTSTSPAVRDFFKITGQSFNIWNGSGLVDLTGPKDLLVSCPELYSEGYFSVVATNQSYICSVPVDKTYGEVINHQPALQLVNYFANQKPISQITISIVDAETNMLLPLTIDYTLEMKLFLTQPINQ